MCGMFSSLKSIQTMYILQKIIHFVPGINRSIVYKPSKYLVVSCACGVVHEVSYFILLHVLTQCNQNAARISQQCKTLNHST